MAENNKDFNRLIVEYINSEIDCKKYSDDNLESLEVAKQCLEAAWGIETSQKSNKLVDMFHGKPKTVEEIPHKEISEEDKKAAERLKCQGNICMGENLYSDALSCYTMAIDLDPINAVYYCNRAAAYTKMGQNDKSIEDCQKALTIDSNYSKAYSRLGLAYSAIDNFDEAIKCYKRAIEIEPDNQNYKQNLMAAQEKKSAGTSSANGPSINLGGGAGPANFQSLLGNMDINSILSNPAMMNMAQDFMSRPEMRDMMGQMMSQMMGPQGPQAGGPPTPPNNENEGNNQNEPANNSANPSDQQPINDFLNFGQQLAHQVQSSHPGLVESMRQRYMATGNNNENNSETTDDTESNQTDAEPK